MAGMKYSHPVCLTAIALLLSAPSLIAETAAVIQSRVARDAQLLSADEFAGRAMGSPELERAAEYVRKQFDTIGLKTDAVDGSAFQRFEVTTAASLGEDNHVAFVGVDDNEAPALRELKLDQDYSPMAIGGGGEFSLPIAFVGYGITAPEANYDDYAGIDVTGKAVIIMRHEPEQANPHSAFNGTEHSRHAPFRAKVSNAVQHGAAAVIFTTDAYEILQRSARWEKRVSAAKQELEKAGEAGNEKLSKRLARFEKQLANERDPLLGFLRAGQASDRDLPVLYLRPSVIDRLLKSVGQPPLRELEATIDKQLAPSSFLLPQAQLVGKVDFVRKQASISNVIGVLPGAGPKANETLVIGAHYDHVGRGQLASRTPGSGEIHNGADDNASGVAGLLAIARQLISRDEPLDRTVVFIAFTAEENGLLGSAHYAKEPVWPLESTVAMLNLDMVGRLRNNELTINGVGTAEQFKTMVDSVNQDFGFSLSTSDSGYGPSDHASFYAKKVPVLHFFTGLHDDYHQPGDDFELLNLPGIVRISRLVSELAERLAEGDTAVTYVEVEPEPTPGGKTDPRPYFGSIPDFAGEGAGYAITGVAAGSPAEVGGVKGGDKIIGLGENKISNLEDFDNALRKFVAGDKVKVVVLREGAEVTLEVELDPPR